jgi:predicted NACHT family NTPase
MWERRLREDPQWIPATSLISGILDKTQPDLYQELAATPFSPEAHGSLYGQGDVAEYYKPRDAQDVLRAISLRSILHSNEQRSVVVGIPGSGKTSSCKYFAQGVSDGSFPDWDHCLIVILRDYGLALETFPTLGPLEYFFQSNNLCPAEEAI